MRATSGHYTLILTLFLLCPLLCLSPALASNSTLGQWSGFFSQVKLNKHWGAYIETQTRLHEGYKSGDHPNPLEVRNNRFLLRPALIYYPFQKNSLQLHFGYGWTPNLSPKRDENRIYQQILYQTSIYSETSWSIRARLEQRRVEFTEDTAWRFRLFSRLSQNMSSSWGWVIWDEVFWNLNDVNRGPSSGFEQNRIFIGSQINISDKVRWEIGYIHNYMAETQNTPNVTGHILALYAFLNWD